MKDLLLLGPELILASLIALLVFAELTYHRERVRLVLPTALFGLAAAGVYTVLSYSLAPAKVLGGVLSADGLSLFFKLFFIALSFLALVNAAQAKEIPLSRRTEYSVMILAGALFASIASAASDILLIFLCLQGFSLVAYLLAAFGKTNQSSVEAAIKYLGAGALATAFFLFAGALLFGATGTINLYDMRTALPQAQMPGLALPVLFILLLMSLGYFWGAFPMAMIYPDVLEGSPTPASGFIAVGARAVGLAVGIRLLIVVFTQGDVATGRWSVSIPIEWPDMVSWVAGATALYGSLLSLKQTSVKRMLSCLVVVQTSFLLMGVLVLDEIGVAATLYNLMIDLFALTGSYAILAWSSAEDGFGLGEATRPPSLATSIPETGALILFLACLVGLPPFPGFVGKFTLIGSIVSHEWYALAVVGIVSMMLSSVGVFRLAFRLIGDYGESSDKKETRDPLRTATLAVAIIPLLVLGVFAEQVLEWTGRSLRFILW